MTGSQSCPQKNFHPKACHESWERLTNCQTMSTRIASTMTAQAKIAHANTRSANTPSEALSSGLSCLLIFSLATGCGPVICGRNRAWLAMTEPYQKRVTGVLKRFRPAGGKLRLGVSLESGEISHQSGKQQHFRRYGSRLRSLPPRTFFIAQPL